MDVLQRENPDTIVHWDKEGVERNPGYEIFKRVFWSFVASIEGFKHCRPVINIDGTHLYGKYKGVLLIAVSCDANNQLISLAFAIVEGENNDSWGWFMACIKCFVTQRDASNFNNKFHDKTLKNLVWRAANENQVRKFDKRMETIGKINEQARKWLEEIPLEKWALAYDNGRRYDIMTTNLSEVFNSVLKGARCLPITALVQLTFYRVNSYFAIRRQLGTDRVASGQNFTPLIDAKLISNGLKASRHEVIIFNRTAGTFSVRTGHSITSIKNDNRVQVVKFFEKSCTCQKWKIFGFPCSHVIAACQSCSLDYNTFVQKWYSIFTYQMTWDHIFNLLPDQAYWPPLRGVMLVPSDSMKGLLKVVLNLHVCTMRWV